jgi:hypothetical protein
MDLQDGLGRGLQSHGDGMKAKKDSGGHGMGPAKGVKVEKRHALGGEL